LNPGITQLFRVPFTVSLAAPANGTFTFTVQDAPGFVNSLNNSGSSLSPTNGLPFTMTVSAVPEPASLGLGALVLAGAGGAMRRFQLRRSKATSC
jgi:hypothetical protein